MADKNVPLRRGDIVFADLSPIIGSEQGGTRPCLVIQNNIGNTNSPTTIVAAITKSRTKAVLPTHFYIDTAGGLLTEKSMVLFEQIRTIDKSRIKRIVGHLNLSIEQSEEMEHCLDISFGKNMECDDQNIKEQNKKQKTLIGKIIEFDEDF